MKYVLKRIFQAVLVLLLVSIIVFVAVRLAPGDPVLVKLGPYGEKTPEMYAEVERQLGLDKSYPVQYLVWIKNAVHGDLGVSMRSGVPVLTTILEKAPISLELIILSVLVALLISIPLGVTAAVRRNTLLDKIISAFSMAFLAIPAFWFGLVVLLVFSVWLGILPASGYVPVSEGIGQNLIHAILPVFALSAFEMANFTRFIRSDMVEVLNSNYVRTAKAKGLPKWKVHLKHGFKNTTITLITVVGLELGTLLGGTVICEQIFGWSGVGWLIFQAISNRDYPMVQGAVLVIAVFMVAINLIIDVLYSLLDPRIRLE
ncbi:peptide ABC transporter [Bacteroidia bacterium]|nr:peptide ABC transporter [Bacteroidia bacterium]